MMYSVTLEMNNVVMKLIGMGIYITANLTVTACIIVPLGYVALCITQDFINYLN
jgi:hypothetical protein